MIIISHTEERGFITSVTFEDEVTVTLRGYIDVITPDQDDLDVWALTYVKAAVEYVRGKTPTVTLTDSIGQSYQGRPIYNYYKNELLYGYDYGYTQYTADELIKN